MRPRADIEVEILRPSNPLAPVPSSPQVSPTLLDSLLGLLPPRDSASSSPTPIRETQRGVGRHIAPAPATQGPRPPKPLAEAAPATPDRLPRKAPPADAQPATAVPAGSELLPLDLGFDSDALSADRIVAAPATELAVEPAEPDLEAATNEGAPAASEEVPARGRKAPARNLQERLRGLKPPEQQRMARLGEQVERVALERIFGKAVWENLLRNPKISPPEVARIARMGTISRPLLETIVNNRAWLSSPQVRRALLQNRRLKNELIMTVLRATPKNELRLVPKQTAYAQAVRDAAQKLMK